MKAAIYARVSTSNHGQDVSMQTRELRQFAEARGWQVAGEYVDDGYCSVGEKRPALDKLMADAHKRKFDAVICWKFDRFARSVSHLLRALENFNALGIAFVSLTEQMDTTTPTGKMVFTVLGAVAELERSLIAERVRAGLRNAVAKGKKLGRPCRELDAAKIAALRKQGWGWKRIAWELDAGVGTVLRVGKKPAVSHDAAIPKDVQQKLRKMIAQAQWKPATSEKYRNAPHSYIVCVNDKKRAWGWFTGQVRKYGVIRPWRGENYRYLVVDGHCYWVMWPILNRALASTLAP